MPFTIAHPAIVLPFRRSKRFSLTALMAGSMVPDFEFFFQMREVENVGHQWYGILLFDFPVALIFCFLFHNLLRNPLVNNLPVYFSNRFANATDFNWNKSFGENKWNIIISIFIGILSHILWDGFTHADGLFVGMIAALTADTGIRYFNMPVYFFLQLFFSVLGIWIIFRAIHKRPSAKWNRIKPNRYYWPIFGIIFSTILMIRLAGWPGYNTFWSVVMAVMGAICYSWISVSLFCKIYVIKKSSYEYQY